MSSGNGNRAAGADPSLEQIRKLMNAGDLDAAALALQRRLARSPDEPLLWQLLARLSALQAQPEREIEALRQWLAREPAQASGWLRLARLLIEEGHMQDALDVLRQASDSCRDNARILLARGRTALALLSLQEALECARKLDQQSGMGAAGAELTGDCQRALGEVTDAGQSYRRALELDPDRTSALFALVELAPAAASADPWLSERISALQAAELTAGQARHLHFALALLQEVRAEFGIAAGHLHRANAHALAQDDDRPPYCHSSMEQRVTQMITQLPPTTLQRPLPPLPLGVTPIFIVGLPRSGTTLLERILASHSAVISAGEPEFAQRTWLDFCQQRLAKGRDGPVDPASTDDAEALETAREQYLEGLLERAGSAPWIIDKLPGNFLYAGFLRLLFPSAPILHMLRDPRATCLSLYRANLGDHAPYQHALTDLCHYHDQYRQLMTHWRQHLPDPFLEIRYEQLVSQPEAMTRALLDRLQLPFEAACLSFHRQQATILTASHQQARQPIHTHSLATWRQYGTELGPILRLRPEPPSPRELQPGGTGR